MFPHVNWPRQYDPRISAIYALNEIDVEAPPEVVWKLLVDAENWSSYFPAEDTVKILTGEPELALGTKYSRVTVGLPMHLIVAECVPCLTLSWSTLVDDDETGSSAYHGWVITPTRAGCHVLTEETQQGPFFLEELGRKNPGALYRYHQEWVECLARAAMGRYANGASFNSSECDMNRFEGKAVVVTGAGSGIGAATARRFLQEGAFVTLSGRREHKLQETIAGFDASKSLVRPGDVTDERYIKRLVEDTVTRFGRIDVLVNNAGMAIFGPFEQTKTEDWRKVMETDLDSVYFGCREALPHLLKTKGSIINLSSASGVGGDWGMSSYNAAKGAVTNFTRALALEYGARGVRINAVAPSLTSSEATVDLEKSEAVMAAFVDRLPIGRAATPHDIAGVIAFLASEDALFINGVILPVDGGLGASNGQPNFLRLL